MAFDQGEAAEFNSGLAIIYQLDAIEKELIKITMEPLTINKVDNHYNLLLSYFKTLHQFMNKKEQEQQIEMWEKIKENVRSIKNATMRKVGFPLKLYEDLNCWEMELRQVKKNHGLGMPAKDPRYSGTR